MKWKILFICPILVTMFCGCHDDPGIPAVKDFQLERYLGKWYEIARLPNRFERDMSMVSAEYILQDDGTLKVLNQGMKNGKVVSITGFGRIAGNPGDGDLQVSFFRPFYGMYRIIKLAPDYSYSVVVGSNRSYLWILGRKPELSAAEKAEIMAFLQKYQFPAEKLIWSWQ